MPNLTIMRGFSGSGKSTLAREIAREHPGTVIVSRDNIRPMITGVQHKTVLDPLGEALVTKVQETAVREALRAGRDVIVDDTNLRLKFARRWADIAVQEGATWDVKDVLTPVEECLRRNRQRADDDWVPPQAIESQAKRFRMPWPAITTSVQTQTFKPYVPDTSKPTAFGFDLDGTLAWMDGRGPYDSHLYHTDKVNTTLLRILHSLYDEHQIILLSGRSEDHRKVVEMWLEDNNVIYDALFMRKSGDNRNDAIVKSELFDEHIAPHYNFLCQFDDRDRVVDALRAKGIPVYQVCEGNY